MICVQKWDLLSNSEVTIKLMPQYYEPCMYNFNIRNTTSYIATH